MRASAVRLAAVLTLLLQPAAQGASGEDLAAVRQELGRFDPAALNELLERAEKDPDPAVRRLILDRLSRLSLSGVGEALEYHAVADPDAEGSPSPWRDWASASTSA